MTTLRAMFLLTMAKVSAVSYTVDGGGRVARDTALLQAKASLKDGALEHAMQSPTTNVWAYDEGSISNADYNRRQSYGTEHQVQVACSNDDACKGYWKKRGGSYHMLKSGSRTWAKGVPNGSVTAVKVRILRFAADPPIPQEARCRFSEEKRNLYIPTTLEQYDSMDEAKTACNANSDCGGVTLYNGNYETRQGPGLQRSGAGASSWVCEPASQGDAPSPRPVPRSIPQKTRCRFSEENRNLYIPTTLEQYDSMDEAKTACNANSDCGGVTLYNGNYETRQGPGLQRSGAGASSWVCETTSPLPRPTPRPVPAPQPSPQPSQPLPQPSPQPVPGPVGACKFSEEKQNLYIPAPIEKHSSLQEAKDACDSDENCGGITLYKGNYETRVGGVGMCLLSSGSGATSWACERAFKPAPQARPGRGPNVPDSVTCYSRSRDTTTVRPDEWEYFLAFQEDRRKGHSSPCKAPTGKWADCGKGLGHMESGNTPSPVKGRNSWLPNPVKVIFDCKMWVAAYRHAEDQAIQGYFNHFGENPRTSERERSERVGARSRGEHQAGRESGALGALRGLQSSPGHSNSMFQPKYKGMAVAHGKQGKRGIWTALYNMGGDMIEDSESCIPEGYTATGDRK